MENGSSFILWVYKRIKRGGWGHLYCTTREETPSGPRQMKVKSLGNKAQEAVRI